MSAYQLVISSSSGSYVAKLGSFAIGKSKSSLMGVVADNVCSHCFQSVGRYSTLSALCTCLVFVGRLIGADCEAIVRTTRCDLLLNITRKM